MTVLRCPKEIFFDLMKPLESGDMNNFEWEDDAKTTLTPTLDRPSFLEYRYTISKPQLVDKFWRLQEIEGAREKRDKDGEIRPSRRGLGSARLHLSKAAEGRGERTHLLAQVTGNVVVSLKVPKGERAMPFLKILYKVSTMNKTGHVEWATAFTPKTAAALRKQMVAHLQSMMEDPSYPTLEDMRPGLTKESSSVRPLPVPANPPPANPPPANPSSE